MTDDAKEKYLLEEMKVARSRIDAEIATMNQFEILSFTAIGASYLLILQFSIRSYWLLLFCLLIPLVVSLYGLFRYRAHAAIVKIHEEYIKRHIETVFLGDRSGLVFFYDEKKPGYLKQARMTFWVAIFLVSFAMVVVQIVSPEKIIVLLPSVKAS